MRDVAEHADVALGTVYRYFSCKDHLLAAALNQWARSLETQVSRRPLGGDTMAERLTDALRRGTRPFQRNPHMARLLIITGSSTDPFTSETYAELASGVGHVTRSALDGLDVAETTRILRVVNSVWCANLVAWVNDRTTIAGVYEALGEAAHLLLDHREQANDHPHAVRSTGS